MAGRDHYGDMVDELRDLTELFTWSRKGTLADLLTTDLSVDPVAGAGPAVPGGALVRQRRLPAAAAADRAGLLQRAALLVSSLETTNPFHRGAFLRRQLLCDPLPQPDPNSCRPDRSIRRRPARPRPPASASPARPRAALCQPCHRQFNDLGFVLEAFDALGRLRTTEKVFDEQNGSCWPSCRSTPGRWRPSRPAISARSTARAS